MKIPYECPAIASVAEEVIKCGTNRIIQTRPKFVAGIVSFTNWMALCFAVQRRNNLAKRALEMSDSACGWIIAQSLVSKLK